MKTTITAKYRGRKVYLITLNARLNTALVSDSEDLTGAYKVDPGLLDTFEKITTKK